MAAGVKLACWLSELLNTLTLLKSNLLSSFQLLLLLYLFMQKSAAIRFFTFFLFLVGVFFLHTVNGFLSTKR